MKLTRSVVVLLTMPVIILAAFVAPSASAQEERQESDGSEDPIRAEQPTLDGEDHLTGSSVPWEAPVDSGNMPLSPSSSERHTPSAAGNYANSGMHMNAISCHYLSRADRPHISANRRDVSVHGWWHYYSGTCETATVQIWLYHYRCVPETAQCYWALTDYDIVREMPKKAPLYLRANARHSCESFSRKVGFKVVVDVDIDDAPDPTDTAERIENVYCVPW